jgi:hypothetical protein
VAEEFAAGGVDDAHVEASATWAEHRNEEPPAFTWHVTAADILAKIQRARAALTRTKSATDR